MTVSMDIGKDLAIGLPGHVVDRSGHTLRGYTFGWVEPSLQMHTSYLLLT